MQSAFLKYVQSITVVTQYMDNQCLEEPIDIWVLYVGQDQYSRCVDEPLSKCVTTVTDPLSKNKLPLFSYTAVKGPSKGSLQLLSMKSDCNVFSRLCLACQARDGDVNKFVCHGNHPCPPSLSLGGKLRLGSNTDALPYVEVERATSEDTSPPVDVQFLDGAAVVQKLNPVTAKTFLNYAVHVFCHICTWKALLAWTLFGMYFKQIDKIWAKVFGDQLFSLH